MIFPAVDAVYTWKPFPKLCNEAFSERVTFPFKLFSKENCKRHYSQGVISILPFQNIISITQSEVSQKEKHQYSILMHIYRV